MGHSLSSTDCRTTPRSKRANFITTIWPPSLHHSGKPRWFCDQWVYKFVYSTKKSERELSFQTLTFHNHPIIRLIALRYTWIFWITNTRQKSGVEISSVIYNWMKNPYLMCVMVWHSVFSDPCRLESLTYFFIDCRYSRPLFCPADMWSTHSASINLCRRWPRVTTDPAKLPILPRWKKKLCPLQKSQRDFCLSEVLSNLRGHSIARYESELWSAFLWVHNHMYILPSASSHNMQHRVMIAKRTFHCNIQNNWNSLITSLLRHGGEAATLHIDWCMC